MKKRIQPRVLKGNVKKLDRIARERGLSRAGLMEVIANQNFIMISPDVAALFSLFGKKIPVSKKEIKFPKIIKRNNWNVERYVVEISSETEEKLFRRAFSKGFYGPHAIGLLLDLVCSNKVVFIDPEIRNLTKSKRKKK